MATRRAKLRADWKRRLLIRKGRRLGGARRQEMRDNSVNHDGRLAMRISRLHGEAGPPMSHRSPCVSQSRMLLGPTALHTCPLASPGSQVRARLGPGGYCRRSGNGGPRLASLQPMVWLSERARPAHLHQQRLKTLARGQASRGGRHKTSSGAASPGCLARSGDIKAGQTSRGSHDVSHYDQRQADARRAPTRVASLFPLWC